MRWQKLFFLNIRDNKKRNKNDNRKSRSGFTWQKLFVPIYRLNPLSNSFPWREDAPKLSKVYSTSMQSSIKFFALNWYMAQNDERLSSRNPLGWTDIFLKMTTTRHSEAEVNDKTKNLIKSWLFSHPLRLSCLLSHT